MATLTASMRSGLSDMVDTLTCPSCHKLLDEPTLMPCCHSYCSVVNANRGCLKCKQPGMKSDLRPAMVQSNAVAHIRALLKVAEAMDAAPVHADVGEEEDPMDVDDVPPSFHSPRAERDAALGSPTGTAASTTVARTGTEPHSAHVARTTTIPVRQASSGPALRASASVSALGGSGSALPAAAAMLYESLEEAQIEAPSIRAAPALAAHLVTPGPTPVLAATADVVVRSLHYAGENAPEPATPSGSVAALPTATRAMQKRMVIVGTGLSDGDKAALAQLSKLSADITIVENFDPERITHVVTPLSAAPARPGTPGTALAQAEPGVRLAKRTLKYMQGIAVGAWVVGTDWVQECISQGRLVDEAPFEIQGDMKSRGGPEAGRRRALRHEPALFAGQRVYVLDPLDKMSISDMKCLLSTAGAAVLDDELSITESDTAVTVITCIAKCPARKQDGLRSRFGDRVLVVDQGWALDSISQFRILPLGGPTSPSTSAAASAARRSPADGTSRVTS